jgi:transcriptional regulator with XRE-family HTH domain/Zn-dependent peptidase ImmA (M78 family)
MNTELVNIIFGLKVKQARRAAGLTLSELAAASELSPSYMTEIEKGRKYPRADKILRMAEALKTPYDELVSILLGPTLAHLETALKSPLLQEFPFEEFGLDISDLVDLLTRAPAEVSALLHAILEIGRQYDLREEHFFWAMLRSFQEIHDNYFPDLEEAAADFAQSHNLTGSLPVSLESLRTILQQDFNYELEESMLGDSTALAGYRSVFIQKKRPRLLINSHLRPMQIKFLLAREIGYQYLGLKERSFMSSPDQVESFRQVHNDFQASYFAGSLLLPKQEILADIEELFGSESWQPQLLLNMLARYDITPEMLLYRFSELVPQFFGLKLHFLRVHESGHRLRLVKRLNMNRLPIPSGLALYEHYCRRWLTARLLREMDEQGGLDAFRERPLVGVQMSEFLETQQRFLCIGFARPLVLSPHVGSSVIVGFRDEPNLGQVIRFLNDPAVPSVVINETCERCPLTYEECKVRTADPTVLEAQIAKTARQEALQKLMAQFHV